MRISTLPKKKEASFYAYILHKELRCISSILRITKQPSIENRTYVVNSKINFKDV